MVFSLQTMLPPRLKSDFREWRVDEVWVLHVAFEKPVKVWSKNVHAVGALSFFYIFSCSAHTAFIMELVNNTKITTIV